MSVRKSQGKPSPAFVLIDDARNVPIYSVPLSALCDPRLRAIAAHAIHSLERELQRAEGWLDDARIDVVNATVPQVVPAAERYREALGVVLRIRTTISLAREILGAGAGSGDREMRLSLKIDDITIIKRIDRRDVGTDRYEVRCMCGAVLIRSAATLRQGGTAIGREHDFLGCRACYAKAARLAAITYGPPRDGGVA